jgi:hypothetical protein
MPRGSRGIGHFPLGQVLLGFSLFVVVVLVLKRRIPRKLIQDGELASLAHRSSPACFQGGCNRSSFCTAMPSDKKVPCNNNNNSARSSTASSTTKAKVKRKAIFGRDLNNQSPSPENVTVRKRAKFIPLHLHGRLSVVLGEQRRSLHVFYLDPIGSHCTMVISSALIANFMKMPSVVVVIQKGSVGTAKDSGVQPITLTSCFLLIGLLMIMLLQCHFLRKKIMLHWMRLSFKKT